MNTAVINSALRDPRRRRHAVAAALTAFAEVLLIWLVLTAPPAADVRDDLEALKTFDVAPPPPPERVLRKPQAHDRPEGAAAPPNIRSKASEIVALPPIVPRPITPPVITAPVAATGRDASSGASDVRGPGTGAGGVGNGTGSGGAGDGDGDGGAETPPRWRKGRLKDSDYPRAAGEAGVSGTVTVRYLVMADGRVGECDIVKSSGNGELDETTCRLIRERFRFDPSRDAAGRPVPAWLRENHAWSVEDDPPPER